VEEEAVVFACGKDGSVSGSPRHTPSASPPGIASTNALWLNAQRRAGLVNITWTVELGNSLQHWQATGLTFQAALLTNALETMVWGFAAAVAPVFCRLKIGDP
jgi:hypothetical protein